MFTKKKNRILDHFEGDQWQFFSSFNDWQQKKERESCKAEHTVHVDMLISDHYFSIVGLYLKNFSISSLVLWQAWSRSVFRERLDNCSWNWICLCHVFWKNVLAAIKTSHWKELLNTYNKNNNTTQQHHTTQIIEKQKKKVSKKKKSKNKKIYNFGC